MKKIKVGTVCSGIGSPEVAINRLAKKYNFEVENIFACDYDKFPRQSYKAIHGDVTMFNDMTSDEFHENSEYCDLFIGGIPCQAFSLAGKRLGELDKRGLLFYDFYRYVKEKQPKVFIIENVKGLLTIDNGKVFQNWLWLLGNSVNGHHQMFAHPDSLGYNLHHTILNSKDFGVPQNRERVFIVGIRADLPNDFRFPKGFKLEKRLKDVLESEVNEKYYLSDKAIKSIIENKDNIQKSSVNPEIASSLQCPGHSCGIYKGANFVTDPLVVASGRSEEEKKRRAEHFKKTGKDSGSFKDKTLILKEQPYYDTILANANPQKEGLILVAQLPGVHESTGRVYSPEGLSPTVTAKQGGGHEPKIEEKWIRGGLQENQTFQTNGISPCLTSAMGMGGGQTPIHNYNSRIRRLTPLECWRLQGFPDEAFYKAKNDGVSDSQLYKQAGNSMTVDVMEAIEENILKILL